MAYAPLLARVRDQHLLRTGDLEKPTRTHIATLERRLLVATRDEHTDAAWARGVKPLPDPAARRALENAAAALGKIARLPGVIAMCWVLAAGCGPASARPAETSRPARPMVESERPIVPVVAADGEPSPQPAPSAVPAAEPEIPPSVDPATLPAPVRPLATLGRTLASSGIVLIERVERTVYSASEGEIRVVATVARDGEGTWICGEEAGQPPRCVTVAATPRALGRPDVSDERDGWSVDVNMMEEGTAEVVATLSSDGPFRADRGTAPRGQARTPVQLTPREPPPVVAALQGLEITAGGELVVARAFDWVTVCREGAPTSCTPPAQLEPFARDGVHLDGVMLYDHGIFGIEFGFEEQMGDVYEEGTVQLLAQIDGTAFASIATVFTAGERRARVRLESDELEIIRISMFEIDVPAPGCITIGTPTGERLRMRPNRDERPVGRARLRRAPDRVDALDVDPFTISLAGSWRIEGAEIARVPSCAVASEPAN